MGENERPIEEILLEKIKDAELVLVGIGEEFGVSMEKHREELEFAELLGRMETEGRQWLDPYVEKLFLSRHKNEETVQAYGVLEKLLSGKNYFVVSTRTDDAVFDTGLDKTRIVTPCGGYRLLQCEKGCQKRLYEVDEMLLEKAGQWMSGEGLPEKMQVPLCPECGGHMVFNNVKADTYVEEGYLEQWNNYTKWLQGTVNRKLCVLELGVGMKYPTVIRWPFEKIVFFNRKASLFRVHSKLYQLSEELGDRGYRAEEKPVNFLVNFPK